MTLMGVFARGSDGKKDDLKKLEDLALNKKKLPTATRDIEQVQEFGNLKNLRGTGQLEAEILKTSICGLNIRAFFFCIPLETYLLTEDRIAFTHICIYILLTEKIIAFAQIRELFANRKNNFIYTQIYW